MRTFGLIGYPLSHSFSARYFADKFQHEGISDAIYSNFELESIDAFPSLTESQSISGLNVTIPYKKAVIPFLDELSPHAKAIGAVNVIQFKEGKKIGHNSDWIGFSNTLPHQAFKQAAILGTGGAAQAIQYALSQLKIPFLSVSRSPQENQLDYAQFNEQIDQFDLVINTTPIGTYPKVEEVLPLDFSKVSSNQFFYDLIYNPEETSFMKGALQQGAKAMNGYKMLVGQAEESWKIWNQ